MYTLVILRKQIKLAYFLLTNRNRYFTLWFVSTDSYVLPCKDDLLEAVTEVATEEGVKEGKLT